MEARHVIFFAALFVVVPLGSAWAARDGRIKDACAFILLIGTTRHDLQAINFVSREWYRGTTRGFEICWLDFLWMILLGVERCTRRPDHRGPWPASLLVMLAFLAYNALNVAFSTPKLFGAFELSKMLRAILVFVAVVHYVKGEREVRVLLWALAGAVFYEWVTAVFGRLGRGQERATGTLVHPNILSMYNLIAVPVLFAVALSDTDPRLRRACAVTSLVGPLSVLLTVSRNGLFSMGLVLAGVGLTCGSLRLTWKKAAAAIGVVLVGVASISATWTSFQARFAAAGGLQKEYHGKVYEGRGVYLDLANTIVSHEPWGCGLNNWSYWVSGRYGRMRQQYFVPYPSVDTPPPPRKRIRLRPNAHVDSPHSPPAHTLYGITLGETGWAGVFVFGLLWIRWLQMTGSFLFNRSRALVSRVGVGIFFGLVGAAAQSITEWDFRATPLLFLLHILLGIAAAMYPVRPSRRA